MKRLFLIPARGGSKGLPGKNIMELLGKPLIQYSLEAAAPIINGHDQLCVSTDSSEIKDVVEKLGYKVPFLRPAELATDTSTSEEVIKHALSWYASKSQQFDVVILLQPTSPLRLSSDIRACLQSYENDTDMVVSVKIANDNPYYVMRVENETGFLEPLFKGNLKRRQDAPIVYTINGAVYIINVASLLEKGISNFTNIKKSLMPEDHSIDIDNLKDFQYAEYILNKINEND